MATSTAVKHKARPELQLARLFSQLALGHVHGEDAEAIHELQRICGVQHPDPQRPVIPLFECSRDLTVASAPGGGYLTSLATLEPRDILRPFSVVARAGVQVETGLVGDAAVPKTTAKATHYWLSTEGTQATPSTPTVGQVAMTAKTVGATVRFSRRLSVQANAEAYTRRELLRTVGTAIDAAVLSGSGANGEPLGVTLTPGVNTETGTSLAQAGAVAMKRKCADANAPDGEIAFITTPAVRELLEKRERATGAGLMVWDEDRIASRPGFVTTDMPAATMIAGVWSEVLVGIWGPGFQVELNPYDPTSFKAGVIEARLLVTCDVAVLYPAAFTIASSIT